RSSSPRAHSRRPVSPRAHGASTEVATRAYKSHRPRVVVGGDIRNQKRFRHGPRTADMRSRAVGIVVAVIAVVAVLTSGLVLADPVADTGGQTAPRSEEHTSELQSRFDLVC